jgi:hypothetical protein
MRRLLAAFLLTAVAVGAQEQEAQTPDWLDLCDESETAYGFCAGYVESVSDSIQGWSISDRYCPAKGISIEQKLRAVRDYIQANPVLRRQKAHAQILVALTMTWPCPSEGPR